MIHYNFIAHKILIEKVETATLLIFKIYVSSKFEYEEMLRLRRRQELFIRTSAVDMFNEGVDLELDR